MAIQIPPFETVSANVLAIYRNRFPGRDLSDTSYLGKQARAEAMEIYQLLQAVAQADADAVPTTKTSTAALDTWAQAIGLVASVSGGVTTYGRKSNTTALGLTGTVTGTNAQSVPDGSTLTASDGVTQFKLNNAGATLLIPGVAPGTGSTSATFDALTGGTVGNLLANAVLTWTNTPSGIDSTVKITAPPTTLGIDIESDVALLARIQAKMQAAARGGTSGDYRVWCESVSGVARGYAYPMRGGLGTMHVCITGAGTGTPTASGTFARVPSGATKTSVSNYVNGGAGLVAQRPVTVQGFTAFTPYMPSYGTSASVANGGGITVDVRLVPARTKYNFDWTDTAGWTVDNYVPGTNGAADTLRLNTIAESTLKGAIDNKQTPRIQILVSAAGGPAVPLQCQVTARDADVGGKTTLTLQNPLPTGWVAPNVGDKIYAGGPMVTPIASAILAYIDSLGPSRGGGYAEAVADNWEDTIAVDRVLQICLGAVDTDGTRFAKNALGGGLTNVKLANGTNAAASTDIVASDTTANGPELLWAKWIVIHQ